MKKVRLVPQKQIKKAYDKNKIAKKIDLDEEMVKEKLGLNNVEEIPKEMFSILGETLSFIDKVNKMEGNKDEDK